MSIIGALTSDGHLFQHVHRHAIRATQVVDFLEHLLFFIASPDTVVLDWAANFRALALKLSGIARASPATSGRAA